MVKNMPANAGGARDAGSYTWVGKIPWRRAQQLALVFLPGESHGQRSLVCCSLLGRKESNMTEVIQHACTCPCDREKISFLQSRLAPLNQLTSQQIQSSFSLPDSQIQFPYPKPGDIQHAIPEPGEYCQAPVICFMVVSLIYTEHLFKGMLIFVSYFIVLKRVLKLLNVKRLCNERTDK